MLSQSGVNIITMIKIILLMSILSLKIVFAEDNLNLDSFSKKKMSYYNRVKWQTYDIRIKKVPFNKEKSIKWIKDQKYLLMIESQKKHVPYAGAITQDIDCKKSYVPKDIKVEHKNYIAGVSYFTDHRKRQNNCDNTKIKYEVALMIFSCKNSIYQLKAYNDKLNNQNIWSNLAMKVICS
jgi:hypothetical protein